MKRIAVFLMVLAVVGVVGSQESIRFSYIKSDPESYLGKTFIINEIKIYDDFAYYDKDRVLSVDLWETEPFYVFKGYIGNNVMNSRVSYRGNDFIIRIYEKDNARELLKIIDNAPAIAQQSGILFYNVTCRLSRLKDMECYAIDILSWTDYNYNSYKLW
jgi:hypothetical protein